MTVIVGARDGDRTWIASDEKVTDDNNVNMTPFRDAPAEKWVVRGKWVIALAGECSSIHAAEQCSGLEVAETIEDVRDLLRAEFVDLKDLVAPTAQKGGIFKDFGLSGLIASADGLWAIDPAFDVEPLSMWVAGSGAYLALAVMRAWQKGYMDQDIDLEDALRIAVEVASELAPGCGGRTAIGYIDRIGFHSAPFAAVT